MTRRALSLAPFDPRQIRRLAAEMRIEHESWLDTRRIWNPDDLARRVSEDGVSLLVIEADFLFEDTIELARGLEFIGVCRASTNQVDVEAATRRGILVVNTPGRNARAVAEHALALALALARHIPEAHRYATSDRWRNPAEPYISMRGVEIRGRVMGVVGLGAIGAELAAMCAALGMEVVGYDPYLAHPPPGVELTELRDLMSRSDFVSVHVPTTPETTGLIDAEAISLMRPTAYLVNCSDARIVETDAIVEVLRARRIGGAAFDVFETHPIAPDNPLLTLDNVILTPHIGGATEETVRRHSRMVADDMLRFIRGERPLNLVNPDAWGKHGR